MSFERGAGFRICGAIARDPFARGAFARLTLAVPGQRGETKIDVVAFDPDVIADIGDLGIGMTVQVTGSITMEAVKDKAKNKVKIDGYDRWVPLLVAKKVTVEGSSVKPSSSSAPEGGYGGAADKGW